MELLYQVLLQIWHGIISKDNIKSTLKKTIVDKQSEIYYSLAENIKFLLTPTSQLQENKFNYTNDDYIWYWLVREETTKKTNLSTKVKFIVAEMREPLSYE